MRAANKAIMAVFEDGFPFLFGGTFIEGCQMVQDTSLTLKFPFLFGGTFIEGPRLCLLKAKIT